MLTSLDEVLREARSLIGTTRRFGENDNQFTRWHGHPSWAWCNIYVDYVLWVACHLNGEKSPLEGIDYLQGPAYTGNTMAAGKRGTNGLGWNEGIPRVGQLAIFDFDWAGITDHIGIVGSIPNAGDPNGFYCLEGNTGSPEDVYSKFRRNDRGYVRGFVTVPYGSGVKPPGGGGGHGGVPAPRWPGYVLALSSPLMGTRGNARPFAEIRQWQDRMIHRGWKLGLDGIYGPQSAGACRVFQQQKGLVADGEVGPITWKATWEFPITP